MHIATLFDHDISLMNELVALLANEQSSLINPNVSAVESVIEQKDELLKKISASVKVRNDALAKAGFEPNENGMVAWINKNALRQTMQKWQAFQQSVAQAKELNRLNGQLINKHFIRNRQFIAHLKGNPRNDGVYGPNGHASSGRFSRASVSA